jgi:UPF0755 protein
MRKALQIALIVFALGLVAGAAAVWTLGRPYFAGSGETFVRIERGSGASSIAHTLQKAGVIQYQWQLWAARAMHPSAKLQAGEYRFREPSSALTVFDRIRRGDIYFYDFTVP